MPEDRQPILTKLKKRSVDADAVVAWFINASSIERNALLVVLNEIVRDPHYEASFRHLLE